jgi:MFS family permease
MVEPQGVIPHARWNFVVLGLDLALFGAALSFLSWVTVFPAFLRELGASNVQIGLIGTATSVGFALPPLFIAPFTERLVRKSPFVVYGTIFERMPAAGLACLAVFSAVAHPRVTIWIVLALLFVQTTVGGCLTPAWLDMVAKAVDVRSRGRFFGWASALAGVLGLAGSFAAQQLLDAFGFPNGYAACFAMAFALFVCSFMFLALNREVFPQGNAHVPTTRRQYRRTLVEVIQGDRNFTLFIVSRCLAAFAGAAASFFTVIALQRFPGAALDAGRFTSFLLGAMTAANVLFGSLADRVGHKISLSIGQACLIAATLSTLFAREILHVYASFALLGLASGALNISSFTMTMEFAPSENRPTYIGLVSFATVPFLIVGPLLGGWLADVAGYDLPLILFVAVGCVALGTFIIGVRDPRQVQRSAGPHVAPTT